MRNNADRSKLDKIVDWALSAFVHLNEQLSKGGPLELKIYNDYDGPRLNVDHLMYIHDRIEEKFNGQINVQWSFGAIPQSPINIAVFIPVDKALAHSLNFESPKKNTPDCELEKVIDDPLDY